jgi:hypothetical protein
MATEQVLRIPVDRHIINTERPFDAVLADVNSALLDMDQDLLIYEPVISHQAEPGRVVRIAVGCPDPIDRLTHAVPDAALSVPSAILIQQTMVGGTRLAYDAIASSISRYQPEWALGLAQQLDDEVLGLLRRAADPRG